MYMTLYVGETLTPMRLPQRVKILQALATCGAASGTASGTASRAIPAVSSLSSSSSDVLLRKLLIRLDLTKYANALYGLDMTAMITAPAAEVELKVRGLPKGPRTKIMRNWWP